MTGTAVGASRAAQSANQLLHSRVCTGSGELVGYVDDLLLNPSNGRVEFLSIRPPLDHAEMRVRLGWHDLRFEREAERLLIIPGSTAGKRLLIRMLRERQPNALH